MHSQHTALVDLQPLFFRFSLDTTTALVFEESVHCLNHGTRGERSFAESFNVAQDYLIKRYRLLDFYYLVGGGKFRNACASTHRSVDEITARGLHVLPDSGREDRIATFFGCYRSGISKSHCTSRPTMNILLAGRDTTACLLPWTL